MLDMSVRAVLWRRSVWRSNNFGDLVHRFMQRWGWRMCNLNGRFQRKWETDHSAKGLWVWGYMSELEEPTGVSENSWRFGFNAPESVDLRHLITQISSTRVHWMGGSFQKLLRQTVSLSCLSYCMTRFVSSTWKFLPQRPFRTSCRL